MQRRPGPLSGAAWGLPGDSRFAFSPSSTLPEGASKAPARLPGDTRPRSPRCFRCGRSSHFRIPPHRPRPCRTSLTKGPCPGSRSPAPRDPLHPHYSGLPSRPPDALRLPCACAPCRALATPSGRARVPALPSCHVTPRTRGGARRRSTPRLAATLAVSSERDATMSLEARSSDPTAAFSRLPSWGRCGPAVRAGPGWVLFPLGPSGVACWWLLSGPWV